MPTQQKTSPHSSLTTEVADLSNQVLCRYGAEGARILEEYNPDYIFRHQKTDDDCIFGDYPTLDSLSARFDNKFPVAWLMAHLHDLSEFCGCKNKLSGYALQQCAGVIAKEFRFLKISEMMLFFLRFKSGRYGKFYGAVDPLVITTSLQDFVNERSDVIERGAIIEQKMKEKEQQKEETMNLQEWMEIKTIIAMYNSDFTTSDPHFTLLWKEL